MKEKPKMNHYEWLEKHFPKFITDIGLQWGNWPNEGIYSAHGDKFYSYRGQFEDAGIHFYHGVAIGLLTYIKPYSNESREIPNTGGWIDGKYVKPTFIKPIDWILANKDKFLKYLPNEDLEED